MPQSLVSSMPPILVPQDNAEAFVKSVVKHAVSSCQEDLNFFEKFVDKDIKTRLAALIETPFTRIPYRKAIELLKEEIAKDPSKWQFPDVSFGTDLATEHERWLAEKKFNGCVFVHNYPRKIKLVIRNIKIFTTCLYKY